jgi:MATE family multidrug resistance protein
VPVVIYALSLWGVGLGGGWLLAESGAFGLHGARGFWAASTLSLLVVSTAMVSLLAWVMREKLKPSGSAR